MAHCRKQSIAGTPLQLATNQPILSSHMNLHSEDKRQEQSSEQEMAEYIGGELQLVSVFANESFLGTMIPALLINRLIGRSEAS